MNKAKIDSEMHEDSIIYTDFLYEKVPVEKLKTAFDFANEKRSSSFAPNGFDIKNAYAEIERLERETERARRARELKENPVLNCEKKQFHINADGEALRINPFNTAEDVTVPCWYCRSEAHDAAWTRFVEKNGGNEPKPLEIVKAFAEPKPPPVEEIRLSDDEILALQTEHNSVVCQIVEEENARKNLMLIYDAGANVFKLPHRADLTYSAEVVKKKIENYRRLLQRGTA